VQAAFFASKSFCISPQSGMKTRDTNFVAIFYRRAVRITLGAFGTLGDFGYRIVSKDKVQRNGYSFSIGLRIDLGDLFFGHLISQISG
jgi:hypothetical protein